MQHKVDRADWSCPLCATECRLSERQPPVARQFVACIRIILILIIINSSLPTAALVARVCAQTRLSAQSTVVRSRPNGPRRLAAPSVRSTAVLAATTREKDVLYPGGFDASLGYVRVAALCRVVAALATTGVSFRGLEDGRFLRTSEKPNDCPGGRFAVAGTLFRLGPHVGRHDVRGRNDLYPKHQPL